MDTSSKSTGRESLPPRGSVDYHDFTTRDMPQEERRRLGVGNIWKNAAKCVKCGDEIQSNNRHDCVSCSCGAISVDGGSWYSRGAGSPGDFIWCGAMYDDVKDAS